MLTVCLVIAIVALCANRFLTACVFAGLGFAAQAFAQGSLPDPSDIDAFAKVAFDAVSSGNWGLVASLAVILLVFLARKFGAKQWPFLATDRGGAVLVIVTAVAGGVGTALLAGAGVSPGVLVTAALVALKAAGGFALAKKLFFPSDPATEKPVGLTPADFAKVRSPMEIVNGKGPQP